MKDYDYRTDGYYFVTIVTWNHKKIFVAAPSYGAKSFKDIVEEKIHQISKYYSGVSVDYYVIMPDYIHLILILNESKVSLSRIINAFKSWVTRDIKKIMAAQGAADTKCMAV